MLGASWWQVLLLVLHQEQQLPLQLLVILACMQAG
jgi:hypothetical protein